MVLVLVGLILLMPTLIISITGLQENFHVSSNEFNHTYHHIIAFMRYPICFAK